MAVTDPDPFELTAPAELAPTAAGGRTGETRAEAWQRRAAARRVHMRQRFGPGPEGRTCGGCFHLVRVGHNASSYLKCTKYGITSSEASDWRAKWPACGAFTAGVRRLERNG